MANCLYSNTAVIVVSGIRVLQAMAAMVVAVGLLGSSTHAQTDSGDFLLEYTGSTGNVSLWFTGTGASGVGPVGMQSLTILTLGDAAVGPLMPSGIPGVTAGQGGLNQALATLPPAAFQTFNTGSIGINGGFSEVSNQSFSGTWRTFDLSTPGVSNVLNLGNIAPPGWNSAILSTIFLTDPDGYGSFNYGKFGYALGDSQPMLGAVVPEPTSMATLAVGSLFGLWIRFRNASRAAT